MTVVTYLTGSITTECNTAKPMSAPEIIETNRLLLQKPVAMDADAIYERYASDPDVCRFLAWPMHTCIEDTQAFLEFSEDEWNRWPAGPYLIFSKTGGYLLGSTGLDFESSILASTGFVLAKDAWGNGFATEALGAMRALAADLKVQRLYAHVYPQHYASRRVLEKAEFHLNATLEKEFEFPNLRRGELIDVVTYSCNPIQ